MVVTVRQRSCDWRREKEAIITYELRVYFKRDVFEKIGKTRQNLNEVLVSFKAVTRKSYDFLNTANMRIVMKGPNKLRT